LGECGLGSCISGKDAWQDLMNVTVV
jgi:hypothetical protein